MIDRENLYRIVSTILPFELKRGRFIHKETEYLLRGDPVNRYLPAFKFTWYNAENFLSGKKTCYKMNAGPEHLLWLLMTMDTELIDESDAVRCIVYCFLHDTIYLLSPGRGRRKKTMNESEKMFELYTVVQNDVLACLTERKLEAWDHRYKEYLPYLAESLYDTTEIKTRHELKERLIDIFESEDCEALGILIGECVVKLFAKYYIAVTHYCKGRVSYNCKLFNCQAKCDDYLYAVRYMEATEEEQKAMIDMEIEQKDRERAKRELEVRAATNNVDGELTFREQFYVDEGMWI